VRSKLSKSDRKAPGRTGVKLNRKLATFIICVVIATGFWLLSALSKQYTGRVMIPVIYTHPPKDKVVSNNLVDTVEVELRTSGFRLLLYEFSRIQEPIWVDMRTVNRTRDEGYYYISTNDRLDNFSEQLGAGTRIVKVIPDTIYFNFNKKISKKVPVKLHPQSQITFRNEFQLKDSIVIEPAMVTVSGAPLVIEKLEFIKTEKLVLKDVDQDVSRKLRLEPGMNKNLVDVSARSVQVSMNVAKFTEGSIELPVEVINLPPDYNIRTFPDKVTVKYQVPLSEFENIKPQMFAVIADYGKIRKEQGTKLKVELVKHPVNIKHARVIPDKVEFIIRK
jgi:hypothetical protein